VLPATHTLALDEALDAAAPFIVAAAVAGASLIVDPQPETTETRSGPAQPAGTPDKRYCPICMGDMPEHQAGHPIQAEHRNHGAGTDSEQRLRDAIEAALTAHFVIVEMARPKILAATPWFAMCMGCDWDTDWMTTEDEARTAAIHHAAVAALASPLDDPRSNT
jgi:hypothetical protein